jgi:hypothetical protein
MEAKTRIVEPEGTAVDRQQLHKQLVSKAMNDQATIEDLLEAVFSIGSVSRLYKQTRQAEKTNPSSYQRGGPSPNSIGVIYENKNMVMGPDGALHQE